MTPLGRIQRTEEEGEEVIPIYPIWDEGGNAQFRYNEMTQETHDRIEDFWNNGPICIAGMPGQPSSAPRHLLLFQGYRTGEPSGSTHCSSGDHTSSTRAPGY